MRAKARIGSGLIQCFGAKWVAYRTGLAVSKRAGVLKSRFEAHPWDAFSLMDLCSTGMPTESEAYADFRRSTSVPFFFSAGSLPSAARLRSVAGESGAKRTIQIADDYVSGKFLLYGKHVVGLGRPVNWLLNPFNGGQHENSTHWTEYPTFSPLLGDIKDVWEPSRFACAFWLVRAYALTGDEKYPAAFWELFESWCRQNPPNRGPNWKCGQETAIRAFGWCFALQGFLGSPATTAARVTAMAKALVFSASRISGHIDYAISQKNNHGISEAVGLLTIGHLFPEFKEAARWTSLGRQVVEQELLRQVYVDGSFVQHSMNYHRVMLHDCIWAARLCELAGEPMSDEVALRIDRASEFLFQMLDTESGNVPNYGANDGALVLPLTACDYCDFRETVQAAQYLSTGQRCLPDGPWNEALLWLFGPDALNGEAAEIEPSSQRFDAGGYYTLRGDDGWCMIRCHGYFDRPAHVDMLHVDLWHRGVNILSDSGSYKYFSPESKPLDHYFKDIRAHNTIEVDGRGPLELVTRFLWLPWPTGRTISHSSDHWHGEHDAYDCEPWNVQHRREVRLVSEGCWIVTDELNGEGSHQITLRWHCHDCEFQYDEKDRTLLLTLPFGRAKLSVEGPAELQGVVRRGDESGEHLSGWSSRYYGDRSPRPTLEISGVVKLPVTVTTRIDILEQGVA